MSLLLLDTTFLIDAERHAADLEERISDDDDVAIAAVTVAELLVGVALATSDHHAARQAFVDDLLDVLPVLPYDLRVAEVHSNLLAATRRAGRPRGAHDLIIAATAAASSRTIVTADPSGFEGLPGIPVATHKRLDSATSGREVYPINDSERRFRWNT
ncbi:type II toxin-antitoxin system VapC family toxin [Egibacter rhizosphaerae]|uniref:Ribonuclease VapC n=1 Tax=Egibacter rhizosphaerae TaxID=1670831 RepID=A0A411YIH9_9ACTN|nr:type II toxin-antitoxin system VapC family toxin [Egibacter rhizosphaerae]